MPPSSLEQIDRDYLKQLYDCTKGDVSVQVSMYEVGEAVDLDRDASSRVAQTLIGLNYVEIKTLSGGIAISSDGIVAIEAAGGASVSPNSTALSLSGAKVLIPADLEAIGQVSGYMKKEAGGLGLDFERLAELVADLRTIDAQLSSSRPKADIVRACLKSIEAIMIGLGHNEASGRLRVLLGD